MSANNDLAIQWDDRASSVRKLKRSGRIPVFGFPHHLRCPGGVVAIVSGNNEIKLTFKASSIEGPQRVTPANGKTRENGWVIRADRRTLRVPEEVTRAPVRGFHEVGAFRYFDARKMRSVLVGDRLRSSGAYVDSSERGTPRVVFRPHAHGIPGLPRRHPESDLVDQYVAWIGEGTRFGHNYLRGAGLFVDLFDQTHWQLIEAKAATSREAVRMAIGQLMDYRRYFFGRRPSLAVLLSSRPTAACIELLSDNRVAAIWRTRQGSFGARRWQGSKD